MTEDRVEAITRMAAEGKSGADIAFALGVSETRVYQLRKKYGIPAGRPSGGWKGMWSEPQVATPVIEPELVYEENGVTVRRYPARWAETLPWGKVVR